ncbi:MAG TPA: TetR/AcrR family transcriptional regulator [Mycobacteriales bacterium]|nr:TetR/AcrR family transcriptional regulator [Mycobacteriales bacterium]
MSTSTRDRILDAAAEVMTRLGLARTTTKEIARSCGCSEALLYKHFRDKEEIFLGVLKERLPNLTRTLAELPSQAGTGSVRDRLVEVVELGVRFYAGGLAIGSSMLGDPGLVARHREWLLERGVGPHRANEMLADYLRAEQKAGRVAADADPDAAAALLLGACYQRAFLVRLVGEEPPRPPTAEFAESVVDTMLRGLAP